MFRIIVMVSKLDETISVEKQIEKILYMFGQNNLELAMERKTKNIGLLHWS